ncbi:hypothetical protein DFH08DRAFT_964627 [Mycena albidolilacea]|uniref:Uncharacterized protein n=1 Tax=Mycena albidolilacea TaxID=1033008 RepID=A0AAD6ZTD1_9AGAR|nr:hypothetical protein DFH08DRAFT_964627 [Mycena albidolilacea]
MHVTAAASAGGPPLPHPKKTLPAPPAPSCTPAPVPIAGTATLGSPPNVVAHPAAGSTNVRLQQNMGRAAPPFPPSVVPQAANSGIQGRASGVAARACRYGNRRGLAMHLGPRKDRAGDPALSALLHTHRRPALIWELGGMRWRGGKWIGQASPALRSIPQLPPPPPPCSMAGVRRHEGAGRDCGSPPAATRYVRSRRCKHHRTTRPHPPRIPPFPPLPAPSAIRNMRPTDVQ